METKVKTKTGVVVSDKMDKTVVVRVDSVKTHPIYKKKYYTTKKFHVHNDLDNIKAGDMVSFVECKPISKTKHHKVISNK